MSSTNKTSLGLNMWEASDKPVRQDFVNDNVIIDEKISELNSNNVIVDEKISKLNSNLGNKANTSDIIDKVRLTGTVTTATDAKSPLGYSGTADITTLSGYPTGKEIIARVPMIAYSSTTTALIYFLTSTGVAVTAKSAATYTYIVDVLYKRG
ncbi:hypothetical protein [Lacrimispora brassicae]